MGVGWRVTYLTTLPACVPLPYYLVTTLPACGPFPLISRLQVKARWEAEGPNAVDNLVLISGMGKGSAVPYNPTVRPQVRHSARQAWEYWRVEELRHRQQHAYLWIIGRFVSISRVTVSSDIYIIWWFGCC